MLEKAVQLCSLFIDRTLKGAKDPNAAATVPSSADAVVIGGGVAGCSVLYHLSKFGLTNSVLVEKEQLTAGTTWHTAGKLCIVNLFTNCHAVIVLSRSTMWVKCLRWQAVFLLASII